MVTSARELHQGMFKAIQDHDYEAFRQLFASEAVHTSTDGEAVVGPDPVAAEVEAFVTASPDLAIDIRHQHVAGPTTSIIEYTFRGTHRGPLEDIPPTGKSVAVVACSVLEAGDGTIKREADYFDTMVLLTQLGVME